MCTRFPFPPQLAGGILGGCTYVGVVGRAMPLAPSMPSTWTDAAIAELLFTFVLCFTVLSVATTRRPLKEMFGLAIGFCVVIGGFAVGKVSGASLNPAVSVGIDFANMVRGGKFLNSIVYSAAEIAGGALATGAFWATRPEEFVEKLPK